MQVSEGEETKAMAFGKKNLSGPNIQALQKCNDRAKMLLTEQYILDKLDGRTTCRFCRQPLALEPSCPKCSIYKRPP
jgi:hypothetical protein